MFIVVNVTFLMFIVVNVKAAHSYSIEIKQRFIYYSVMEWYLYRGNVVFN